MEKEPQEHYPIDRLIEGICKRPDMYVMGGQFMDVVNFLAGFFTGLARDETVAEEVARFNGFCNWLHDKLDWPRSIAIWNEISRTLS